MPTQIIIIALIVLAIHYSLQEGEIFAKLGDWMAKALPYRLHPPAFECNVCMTPWYGSVLYVVIWGVNWHWPIVVIAAMGIQVIVNKWAPDRDDEEDD